MSEYYAVQRSGANELEHYGIKGMKWHVRKAIAKGSDRALGRQYKKAAKKLAKLEKRAASGKKYAKRAAKLGAGAAAAGGLAALGTSGASRLVRETGSAFAKHAPGIGQKMYEAGDRIRKLGPGPARQVGQKMVTTGRALRKAKAAKNITQTTQKASRDIARWSLKSHDLGKLGKVSNSTLVRAGAGAVGAGLAGAAGYNAYRAATTKRAAKKAAAFKSEMNKAFAGTKYANGAPRQGKKSRKR